MAKTAPAVEAPVEAPAAVPEVRYRVKRAITVVDAAGNLVKLTEGQEVDASFASCFGIALEPV